MERKSNIELLRIVAMLFVVLLHANYFSLGRVDITDIIINPIPAFFKAYLEQLCIVCVNVFVLISGWFGIRPTLKGGLSLLFQVFFFHILIILVLLAIGESIPASGFYRLFYEDSPYWFVIAYLILYAVSPILNAFIETVNVRTYLSVLVLFFLLEFAFGWMSNVAGAVYNEGYSAISFMGLYLLARYLYKYPTKIITFSIPQNIMLYFLFSLLPILLFFLTKREFNYMAYTSPFVISASVFFFMAFNKMKFSNKVINYLACSSFAIYLVHLHPLVKDHFICLMRSAFEKLGGMYILFAVSFAIILGLICMILDKVRIFVWKQILKSDIIHRLHLQIENLYSKIGF
ncbi:MAG: acyltransferase family protein [Paraprevotella sp.]|nr:acyltransferase family protein [Paraprevotella sp.]